MEGPIQIFMFSEASGEKIFKYHMISLYKCESKKTDKNELIQNTEKTQQTENKFMVIKGRQGGEIKELLFKYKTLLLTYMD